MPVVNVFCGSYCGAEEVVRSVIEKTGYMRLDDADSGGCGEQAVQY